MTQKLIKTIYIQHVLQGNHLDNFPDLEKQILAKFGYNYQKPPPTYQLQGFVSILYFLRDELFNETSLTDDEKFEQIGYFTSKAFFLSSAGQVLTPILRIVGLNRSILSFLTRMRNVFPWTDFSLNEVTPDGCTISYQPLEVPATLFGGSIQAILEQVGLKNIEISTSSVTPEHHLVKATWTK